MAGAGTAVGLEPRWRAVVAVAVAAPPPRMAGLPGPGLRRGRGRRAWWRRRRRLHRRQQRATHAQPGNGQLGATACDRGIVAFVDEPDTELTDLLGCEQSVTERVGDLLDPAPIRGGVTVRKQLDAGTAVEARAYLVVLHLTPLPGKFGTRAAASRHDPRTRRSRASTEANRTERPVRIGYACTSTACRARAVVRRGPVGKVPRDDRGNGPERSPADLVPYRADSAYGSGKGLPCSRGPVPREDPGLLTEDERRLVLALG